MSGTEAPDYPVELARLTRFAGESPRSFPYGSEPDQFAQLWVPAGPGRTRWWRWSTAATGVCAIAWT